MASGKSAKRGMGRGISAILPESSPGEDVGDLREAEDRFDVQIQAGPRRDVRDQDRQLRRVGNGREMSQQPGRAGTPARGYRAGTGGGKTGYGRFGQVLRYGSSRRY